TGIFTWLQNRGRHFCAGARAGTRLPLGYWQIYLGGKRYLAHRLAWLYMTGAFPTGHIDHINRDPSDNRWVNLRAATPSQNLANQGLSKSNKSGFKGVCWNKRKRKWQAGIRIGGKQTWLGLFSDPAQAHAAYVRAAIREFGEFARAA
ncbi:MAG: HNH endonuclease, partial [Thaumarchaeota archaeon]|nr:HNH endonuclease [Nitrososphaerota archaeon]